MKKYKICVYAICKNEEKFIERWVKSMSEADEIYVLDTGSTDNSVKKLKSLGVNVYEKKFKSFRFDDARNESLKLIPDDIDICVCTDLDEIFIEGWRKNLENSLKKINFQGISQGFHKFFIFLHRIIQIFTVDTFSFKHIKACWKSFSDP